ncbi:MULTISPECIES: O-antigen ligase family protein [unclassified Sphingomonas]|uniref:O-antigen ligase family protein n=1 Tax=unclassified Sphingomonas TaxID=196159 RepID=UPI000A8C4AC8|nr:MULTISPECIES: O-antigen ligase family protein [unclassified Sphingomonas]
MWSITLNKSFVDGQLLRRTALFTCMLLSGGNLIFPRIPLAALLVVICILIQGIRFLTRREFGFCIFILLLTFVLAILNADDIFNSVIAVRFANFLLGLMILSIYIDAGGDAFVDDIYPILKFMCFQSIATTIVGLIAPAAFSPFYVDDASYYTIGLILTFHTTVEGGSALVRPDGFFYEPGVFQLYLNMFAYFAMFVRRIRKDFALAVVAVLCTQSTTGVFIVSGLVGLYFLRPTNNSPKIAWVMQIILIAPIVMGILLAIISTNVDNKFTGANRGSSWAREYDLWTGLAIASEYPLTGIGFDYDRYYQEAYYLGYKESKLDDHTIINRSSSNGIVAVFYSLGFLVGSIYIYGLFRQKFIRGLVFPSIIFVSLLTEAFFFTPMILMFVFSGMLRSHHKIDQVY